MSERRALAHSGETAEVGNETEILMVAIGACDWLISERWYLRICSSSNNARSIRRGNSVARSSHRLTAENQSGPIEVCQTRAIAHTRERPVLTPTPSRWNRGERYGARWKIQGGNERHTPHGHSSRARKLRAQTFPIQHHCLSMRIIGPLRSRAVSWTNTVGQCY